MTAISASVPTTATTSRLRAGVVLALVLGVTDLVGVAIWANAPAPLPVNLISVATGTATLIGATAAWHGSRAGAWWTIVTRVVSLLMSALALAIPDAPKDAFTITFTIAVMAATVVAVALLIVGGRRR